MAKGRLAPITRDQLIIQRLDTLQEQINKTRALMRVPTMPVYPDEPVDAAEGELALIATVPEYFQDGEWRTFGGAYYKATQKLTGDASSVVFDSISQAFTELHLSWTATGVDITEELVILATFNDDEAENDYYWHLTSPSGVGDQTDLTSGGAGGITDHAALGFMSCNNGGLYTDYFSTGFVVFPDYTSDVPASIGYSGHGAAGSPFSLDPDVWISGGYRTAAGPLTKLTLTAVEANGLGGGTRDFEDGGRFTLLAF